jgi:hypothetical protein
MMANTQIMIVLALAALTAAAAGCVGPNDVPQPAPSVDQMVVQADLLSGSGGAGGIAGLQATVYFFRNGQAMPVTVEGGLELAVYEGVVSHDALAEARPFKLVRLTSRELGQYVGKSMVGWGYRVPAIWGKDAPAASAVTLVTRYLPARGPIVSGAPVTISLSAR